MNEHKASPVCATAFIKTDCFTLMLYIVPVVVYRVSLVDRILLLNEVLTYSVCTFCTSQHFMYNVVLSVLPAKA